MELAPDPAAMSPAVIARLPQVGDGGACDPLQRRAWLAPLIDALCDPDIAATEVKVAGVITEWGGVPGQTPKPEHGAYVAHMLAVMNARLPWLLPMLDGACAMVAISPGCCSFMTRHRMGETFEIPELLPFTHLLPWVADTERKGAH